MASDNGHYDIVKLLLERGAQQNLLNSKGFTSLDLVDGQEMNSIYANN